MRLALNSLKCLIVHKSWILWYYFTIPWFVFLNCWEYHSSVCRIRPNYKNLMTAWPFPFHYYKKYLDEFREDAFEDKCKHIKCTNIIWFTNPANGVNQMVQNLSPPVDWVHIIIHVMDGGVIQHCSKLIWNGKNEFYPPSVLSWELWWDVCRQVPCCQVKPVI